MGAGTWNWAALLMGLLTAFSAGCAKDDSKSQGSNDGTDNGGDQNGNGNPSGQGTDTAKATFLYNGAIRIQITGVKTDYIDVSAPIFPEVLKLYQAEGSNYPSASHADRVTLIDNALMTYDFLLTQCNGFSYPVTLGSDTTLTAEQLAANYATVAKCSYEHFTAKPYLIPQLVDDEDICQQKLGSGWSMLTEADITGWGAEVFTRLEATLSTAVTSDSSNWGSFYFSLVAFVRATDGTLKAANLDPAATIRLVDLPAGNRTNHLEMLEVAAGQTKTVVPRCLRRTES
jgi:hypothetical protein